MKEFISIFTEAYREDKRQTNATVVEVLGTFFALAGVFLLFIYIMA